MIKKGGGEKWKNENTDISTENVPTIEPEGLHMENHHYHVLIWRKLCMKANTENIFMKQLKSSAIIDCTSSIAQKLPNVQCIVNLLWHILHPPVAELFKMQVHLISSSFKV